MSTGPIENLAPQAAQVASAATVAVALPTGPALSAAITEHPVVVCLEKQERGPAIETMLSKAGYKVFISVGIYDALKLIAQEMPHLVICDSTLHDGTAVDLFNKIQLNEAIRPTPVLVNVVRKTREEVASLQKAKFAGFILGSADPGAFLAKVKDVIAAKSVASPYFIDVESRGIVSQVTVSMEAMMVGRNGENVVAKSATELDAIASVMCVSRQGGLGPALLRMATNMKQGDELFNVFPISKITGSGLKWIVDLPDVGAESDKGTDGKPNLAKRRIVFFDPNETRAEQFKKLLGGYDIEVISAKTLGLAAQILKREAATIRAVYLHELLSDSSSMEWKTTYSGISLGDRPPLIVGTTSQMMKSTSTQVRYIKRPFGLGQLVEALEAGMLRPDSAVNTHAAAVPAANLPITYQAPAKLIGLDESGGILQIKFPIAAGSRIDVANALLTQILGGKSSILVSSVGQVPGRNDLWQARFSTVDKGTSKAKHYSNVQAIVNQLVAAIPKVS